MKSWTPPTPEMLKKILTSVKKETDRKYFFTKLMNPLWLEPLRENGFFSNPPSVRHFSDGNVQYPFWPEMIYLVNIASEVGDQVAEVVLSIPITDNPCVCDGIIQIAMKLSRENSGKLYPKIREYALSQTSFLPNRYPDLLSYWSTQGNTDVGVKLAAYLIGFKADPNSNEKWKTWKGKANSYTPLEPKPLFGEWEYQEILEKGVLRLAEKIPFDVACILCEAADKMLDLSTYSYSSEKDYQDVLSELWCRRLDKSEEDFTTSKEILIRTLTAACEFVYTCQPEAIEEIDTILSAKKWLVFNRIQQHLYALYPNETTLPKIRTLILQYSDYDRCSYHYEHQLMIRRAVECFGSALLSQKELSLIISQIMSGPSEAEFKEWMGEKYTKEQFQQRQNYFHREQLRPFKGILQGQDQEYYLQLEAECNSEEITDDSYSPYKMGKSGVVAYRSPKSFEDLKQLADAELLDFINVWQEKRHEKDDWLVKVNIPALAREFHKLFKECILFDIDRFDFWIANRDRVLRPIFITGIVQAMEEELKERRFDALDKSLEFCSWVIMHEDLSDGGTRDISNGESSASPCWRNSRSYVVNFIKSCVSEEIDISLEAREQISHILATIIRQSDSRLDSKLRVFPDSSDLIGEAINNTRCRTLEVLVNYGFWVKRKLPDDNLSEIMDIIAGRVANDTDIQLTKPERAMIAMHFWNLFYLNRECALSFKEDLFPKDSLEDWLIAFSSYIRYNPPVRDIFPVMHDEFKFALENLSEFATGESQSSKVVNKFGQHLFFYYLWEVIHLEDEANLLKKYYDKTSAMGKSWGNLLGYIGRSLCKTEELSDVMKERIMTFLNWRLDTANQEELLNYTLWLKSECLESEWRLDSYSKILDIVDEIHNTISIDIETLCELLNDHLCKVVDCFAKVTDHISHGSDAYFNSDKAKQIIRSGLDSGISATEKNAERARENLLRLGRFEYLDID